MAVWCSMPGLCCLLRKVRSALLLMVHMLSLLLLLPSSC